MRTLMPLVLLSSLACATTPTTAPAPSPDAEIAGARALFEANLKAIQDKDRDAYLASYRQDERLVRVGIDGPKPGFQELADGTSPSGSDDWPSRLDADDVTLHWIAPGLVFGTYRYTVTIEGVTTTGLSERVFLKRGDAWEIAVTTAFEGSPTPPAPPQE